MKDKVNIEMEAPVEFIPNKRYRASVWRTDEGNIFVRRSKTGTGQSHLTNILTGKGFNFATTKDTLKLTIGIEKPRNNTEMLTGLMEALNAAILAAHKSNLIQMLR